jgi:hypothetical protein
MILDASMRLSNSQAVTVTAPSANVIDLGVFGVPQLGSNPFRFRVFQTIESEARNGIAISIDQPFSGITSLAVAVETALDMGFTAPTELFRSPAYTVAQLNGATIIEPDRLPVGTYQRYMRLKYIVVGGPAATGRISAAISDTQRLRLS